MYHPFFISVKQTAFMASTLVLILGTLVLILGTIKQLYPLLLFHLTTCMHYQSHHLTSRLATAQTLSRIYIIRWVSVCHCSYKTLHNDLVQSQLFMHHFSELLQEPIRNAVLCSVEYSVLHSMAKEFSSLT